MGDEISFNIMSCPQNKTQPENDPADISSRSGNWPRFILIKSKEPGRSICRLSPFIISKALQGIIGEPKSVKKLRSGDLLVECSRKGQADSLLRSTTLHDLSIEVVPHRTLNSSKGVVRSPDLSGVSEQEMTDELGEQGVIHVKRISITKNGHTIQTNTYILTFDTPRPPKEIKAGYLNIPVTQYIANPLRCFNCQKYGHGKGSCRSSLICFRCGKEGHEGTSCQDTIQCANCKGKHMSSDKQCPKWQFEKSVQKIKTEKGCSFPDARKMLQATTSSGSSYASAVKRTLVSVACQTESFLGGAIPKTSHAPATATTSKSTTTNSQHKQNNKPAPKNPAPKPQVDQPAHVKTTPRHVKNFNSTRQSKVFSDLVKANQIGNTEMEDSFLDSEGESFSPVISKKQPNKRKNKKSDNGNEPKKAVTINRNTTKEKESPSSSGAGPSRPPVIEVDLALHPDTSELEDMELSHDPPPGGT